MAQMIKCSKHKAPNSNPSTTLKKERKKEKNKLGYMPILDFIIRRLF
jgi:hypothetical protein